ncbi:DUF4406 domain-containing protein [Bacteroides reticulotermitis]|uniref:DUF4406 domain-containing protein n=2 Tax=Bacteroides reticulotermitis TaxID=1133319 RepID=W4URU1_9BACE|nr:DUF4406 domain-containing protein [Bacteroides reticulotermitis]MBB4043838.1 hypothetical protein [Bacteroides reticulotermitis]GAE83353.1 hypothetical protein JCM10512_1621 [Bacteroides reticulotermitis JCM 10512]
MKQTYISIPITGHNIDTQRRKAERIKEQIPNSISPFDIVDGTDESYGYYMGKDIEYLLDNCDTIFMCDGWEKSKGCSLEKCAADIYGLKILFENESNILGF